MKSKHAIIWALIGWAVALIFPPQALLGLFAPGKHAN